jgi:molecular chaperone DnaK (HSP70)
MAIAIDFGTSNTVISRWNAATQQAETVTLPGLSLIAGMNPPLIPSLVYVEDGNEDRVLLGQMVRDRGLDLPSDHRFFRGFKRGIGARGNRPVTAVAPYGGRVPGVNGASR